ncbi:hypothetical protein [Paenirhodobacter populi]|uniref:Uncharacterized protein n=1 Tax=Paenirhodobacter populi TaxID=2306993 RepID=A0A443JE19_9RHOB|nr:hypothetical protein [Sinirhodobacter populi]RWR18795.1 hypothetical protein D2T30_15655 [Sinirhodobacter populi]
MVAEFPKSYVTGVTRALDSAIVSTSSPFSYAEQVQDFGGERWSFTIEAKARGREFEVFANSILNKKLPFTFRDWQEGVGSGALIVSGANQSGNSLNVAGAWGDISLRAGDFFSVEIGGYHRLHQLTEDAVPTSGGAAVLRFVPRLRASPSNGTFVEIKAPAVTLRASSKVSAPVGFVVTIFDISAVEAL